MTRYSLPIKRLDGSVTIEPLHSIPRHYAGARRPLLRSSVGINNTEVRREKIFRDIAILALLAITILAGSAVLIGMLWRDVAVAESQERIVIAEQTAQVRLTEAKLQAAADERQAEEILPLILAGFGIATILLVLSRPKVTIGR